MRKAVIRILFVALAGASLAGCGSSSVLEGLNKPATTAEPVVVEATVETTPPPAWPSG
jgi:hypothetical protein